MKQQIKKRHMVATLTQSRRLSRHLSTLDIKRLKENPEEYNFQLKSGFSFPCSLVAFPDANWVPVWVSVMKSKIDLRELVDYISKITGFDKRDIEEILQAEREYLIEKGIEEDSKLCRTYVCNDVRDSLGKPV